MQKQRYKAELSRIKPDGLEIVLHEPVLLKGLTVKAKGTGFSVTYLGITAEYDELPDSVNAFISNVMLALQLFDGQLESASNKKDGNTVTLFFEKPGDVKLYMKINSKTYLPEEVTVERGEKVKLSLKDFEFIY